MSAVVQSLRGAARALPLAERKRRQAQAVAAPDLALLHAVLRIGIEGGEWKSATDFAERCLVVKPRTLRRWLEGDPFLKLPEAIRDKLERLAWAFGIAFTPPPNA
jgi:hypothetical protein